MEIDAIRRGPLTPAEKEYRRKNGLCFYCGKGKHTISECPNMSEKAKKKAQEEELERAMRDRLSHLGFQDNQIQALVHPEKAKELQQGMMPGNPLRIAAQPTYAKIHRNHLDIETLHYYDIPYEYDVVSPYVPFLSSLGAD